MTEKLKPCPFCGNDFPTFSETQMKGIYIRCPDCNITFSRDYYESGRGELGKQRTIEAWNRRAAPEANEPLTLEELRGMDGAAVWVVCDEEAVKTTPGFEPLVLCALVEVCKETIFLTNNLGGRTEYAADAEFEDDGIKVYRRPPEGGEG